MKVTKSRRRVKYPPPIKREARKSSLGARNPPRYSVELFASFEPYPAFTFVTEMEQLRVKDLD